VRGDAKNRGAATVRTRLHHANDGLTGVRDPGAADLRGDAMSTALDSGLVAKLAARISGSVLRPHDADYDSARVVHNALIDRRPALIVRCRTTCDVVEAIALALEAGLEVSIRGGGHDVAGHAVTNGGVMIDLAGMRGIAIDPEQSTATVQGGVSWGEL